MTNFTIDEIKHNIQTLKDKLIKKNRDDGFWVIATRSDFKPLKKVVKHNGKKISETVVKISDIRDFLLKGKEKYFIGKKFAFINFEFNENILNLSTTEIIKKYDQLKNENICKLSIVIHLISNDGKIGINKWLCMINFSLDDLSKLKLKYKNANVFMRQVADKLVISNNMIGVSYKNYVNALKKKIAKN